MDETYLGDGLYASWNGFEIKLRVPRRGGDHWVALDESVLAEFERFSAKVQEGST